MDEQGGEAGSQRAPWSPQDSRTWIITFGAGLAANLATVLVVGAALVFLRVTRGGAPHHRLPAAYWQLTALGIVGGVGLVVVKVIVRRTERGNRFGRFLARPWVGRLFIGLVSLGIGLQLLVWIGE